MVKFREWYIFIIEKVKKVRFLVNGVFNIGMKKNDLENFVGFKLSIEVCNLEWTDYLIFGVIYLEKEGFCIV